MEDSVKKQRGTVPVTSRLEVELIEFLDAEIAKKRARGLASDRTTEIKIAIRHRQLALMSPEDRRRLTVALNLASGEDGGAGE